MPKANARVQGWGDGGGGGGGGVLLKACTLSHLRYENANFVLCTKTPFPTPSPWRLTWTLTLSRVLNT